jgi:hypothetical protein
MTLRCWYPTWSRSSMQTLELFGHRFQTVPAILLGLIGIAVCGCGSTGAQAHHATSGSLPSTQPRSHPILEYLQVLDRRMKPRTYFRPGDAFGARVAIYLRGGNPQRFKATWRVHAPGSTVISLTGTPFTGPSRGNIFTANAHGSIPAHASAGNGSVTVEVTVAGTRLTRSTGLQIGR